MCVKLTEICIHVVVYSAAANDDDDDDDDLVFYAPFNIIRRWKGDNQRLCNEAPYSYELNIYCLCCVTNNCPDNHC